MKERTALVIISIVILGCYANSLGNRFIPDYDDDWLILSNPYIRSFSWDNVSFFFNPFTDRKALGYEYLPVRDLSITLDYTFWKTNPLGYRITQILLHLAGAITFFFILRYLGASLSLSLTAALIFGIHPVTTEPVNWLSGRKDPLSLFFALISFLFFLRSEGKAGLKSALSVFFFIIAFLSKFNAVILPVLFLTVDIFWLKREKKLSFYMPYFLILFFLILPLIFITGRQAQIQKEYYGGSFLATLPILAVVSGQWIRTILIPVALQVPYPYTNYYLPNVNPGNINVLFSLGLLLTFIVWLAFGVFNALRKGEKSLSLIGGLWFVIALLPVTNLIPIPHIMADRYLYFPCLGFSLFLAFYIERVRNRFQKFGVLFTLLILIPFAALTINRNMAWRDSETLWKRTLAVQPTHPSIWVKLANLKKEKGDTEGAMKLYNRFIALLPSYSSGYIERGNCYRELWRKALQSGKKDNVEQYKTLASADYARAIQLSPRDPEPYLSQASFLKEQGFVLLYSNTPSQGKELIQRAIWSYDHAIKCNNSIGEAYREKALLCRELGRVSQEDTMLYRALNDFNKALDIDPKDFECYTGIGDIYKDILQRLSQKEVVKFHEITGVYQKALDAYKKAILLSPEIPKSWLHRGNFYVWWARIQTGHGKSESLNKAIADYTQVINLSPNLTQGYLNRGAAYIEQGEYHEAMQDMDEAILLEPSPMTYYNRAYLFYSMRQFQQAISDCSKGIEHGKDSSFLWQLFALRGRCHIKLGNKEEGEADWKSAVMLSPEARELWRQEYSREK